jgi:hypothetical protein
MHGQNKPSGLKQINRTFLAQGQNQRENPNSGKLDLSPAHLGGRFSQSAGIGQEVQSMG